MLRSCLFFLLFLSFVTTAYSHPPSRIDITYDPKEEVLSLTIAHITRDLNDHFIRRIEVKKNKEEPQIFYLNRQEKFNEFTYDISLEAEPNDVIKVKANCSKGGMKEEEFTVPEPEEDEAEQEGQKEKSE